MTMKIRTVGTCMKEGFKSVFRNGLMSLASIGTITACLIILGIVYCLVMNVRSFADSMNSTLGMVAWLKPGITQNEVQEMEAQLQARDDIGDYRYVSAEEAWEIFKNDMLGGYVISDMLMDDLNNDNPLKNSANIEIYPKAAGDQVGIVDFLNNSPYVRKVSYSQNASRALSSFAALVTYVGVALIGFLIFIALLLITNTIKLSVYIRKREINIMKYIGATDAFVRLPFVIEGMMIGILGAIIPTALVYFGYDALIRLVENRFNVISSLFEFLSVSSIMQGLIPLFLILSVGVGVIGSSISMRKHLKV